MQIKKEKVVPYKVYLKCDDCDKDMELTRSILMTYPPTYQYICKSCGEIVTTKEQYPTIEYIKE